VKLAVLAFPGLRHFSGKLCAYVNVSSYVLIDAVQSSEVPEP
jgi:hypothetical protein